MYEHNKNTKTPFPDIYYNITIHNIHYALIIYQFPQVN